MSQLWCCPARSTLVRSIRRIRWFNGGSDGQTARLFGAAASDSDDETVPSEKLQRLAEDIAALTLLGVSDLTALLRQKLGLLAAGMGMVPMGMVPGVQSAAPAAAAAEEARAEKTSFDVKLEKFDAAAKIKITKEVRTFTALGLKEAKELVEEAPVVLKSGVGKDDAQQIVEKLKSVGATALME